MAPKYTETDRANAIEQYVSGLSADEVAARTGLNVHFVKRSVREAGVMRSLSDARRKFFDRGGTAPTLRTDIDVNEIVKRYQAGESIGGLSSVYEVSERLIIKRLLDAGVTLRTPAEAYALRNSEQMSTRQAEGRVRKVGWGEDVLGQWLADRGESPDYQRPEGTRNVDLAVASVAVEVWLSSSSPLTDPYCRKRIEYLADRGLTVCYVLVARRTRTLLPAVADQIITLIQAARSNPSAPREHRVIRGCGELAATFGDDLDNVTLVPPSKSCPYHRTGDPRFRK